MLLATRCQPACLFAAMVLVLAAMPCQTARALITGGVGKEPHGDPGWPAGAAVIFNHTGRVAWWEGPPFGGGQWHAECRGDAKALSAVLVDFAKLDVKTKRIVLQDGVGRSFWLNPNREEGKKVDAKIDWTFMVWQSKNWERLRKLPADLNPTDARDAENGPPAQIDVYTGGNVKWADVTVPKGLEVIDRRLEAHGFGAADGHVLEGQVVDLATGKPLAARMRLERIEPKKGADGGGYRYVEAGKAEGNAAGRWVLKKAPAGWHRIIVEAEGYVPRVIGYGQFDGQAAWHTYDGGLSPPAVVSGRVTDDTGRPLADVQVRVGDVAPKGAGRYESPDEFKVQTDADGRFRREIPFGTATIWIHKPGYCRPGLGLPITAPAQDIELKMQQSAQVKITIDFGAAMPPGGYIVHIKQEGGEKIGSWGGSGNIDPKHQITYRDVPPGRYVLTGQPNPGSSNDQTGPLTIELKGGETREVTLKAK